MGLLSKIFGDASDRFVRNLDSTVERINALEPELQRLTDAQLKAKTDDLRVRLKHGETLDAVLPEAFANVREAAKRALGQRHFDVQLKGGMVLHAGKIAEMRTGEGKTLVATLPSYLNALKHGVHVVTVNDYLAARDAVWMGKIHHLLGLTVGCLQHESAYIYDPTYTSGDKLKNQKSKIKITDQNAKIQTTESAGDTTGVFKVEHECLRPVTRREAYHADILYGTNNEFGFDYLRDNLVHVLDDEVQNGHHFAIIDEVDSILIDEARTPLIISQPDEESAKLYVQFAQIVPRLEESKHYNVDEKMRSAILTQEGIDAVEHMLGITNIYGQADIRLIHHLETALKAQVLYKLDKDYVVKDGEVIIVDEFTGRLMQGRRFSEGLHQALEAKEGVEIQRESKTLATITIQNYFRMYEKLAGMTGTAQTSAEEFHKVYHLDVVSVPTHRPMVRRDLSDQIFRTTAGKFTAVAREIAERHKKGQPVLVGTISIERNEYLSALLKREGIVHELLNAKQHEREGQIIAQAGRKGAVTVATNMAGRGVDIILGGNPPDLKEQEEVRELGGLHLLGTERHEARRIDNQLRGRSGRQGDPGSSQFFVSMEDDLLRIFGPDRMKRMMEFLKIPEDQPIEHGMVSRALEQAQGKIEGFNFDIRKHLLEYDDVVNKHRETLYRRRREILKLTQQTSNQSSGAEIPNSKLQIQNSKSLQDVFVADYLTDELELLVKGHTADQLAQRWQVSELAEGAKAMFGSHLNIPDELRVIRDAATPVEEKRGRIHEVVLREAQKALETKEKLLPTPEFEQMLKYVMLRTIDFYWQEHLVALEHLRDSVRLRAYGQRDPLVEYKSEGHRMFRQLLDTIRATIVDTIFKIQAAPALSLAPRAPLILSRPDVMLRDPVPEPGPLTSTEDAASVAGRSRPAYAKPYLGGEKRVGRNDPCPCGSGKKYKRCHGA